MGLMVNYNFLLPRFCAIVSVLFLQGSSGQKISPSPQSSSAVPPITEGAPSHAAHGEQMQIGSPSPISQSNGFHPPPAIKGLGPSLTPITSMNSPPGVKDPIPVPETSVAVPAISPSKELPQHPPVSIPPILESLPPITLGNNLPDNKAPISQSPAPDTLLIAPAPREVLEDPPNVPQAPPSIFPAPVASPPSKFPMSPEPTQSTKPMLPNLTVPIASPPSELPRTSPPIHPKVAAPPSHLTEPNIAPTSAPPRSIDWKRGGNVLVSAPPSGETIQTAPAYPAPVKSPAMHKSERHSIHSPPPDSSNESPPITRVHSPASLPPASFNWHHRARENIGSPMPSSYPSPPPTKRGSLMPLAPIYPPTQDSWSKPRHHAPPLPNPGPLVSPLHSSPPNPSSHMPSSNSPSPSEQTKMPFLSPKISPSRSSPRNPKTPYFPPIQALPPPPPNKDCSSITCMDPLTNPAPGAPCNCVLPMQIGLRLTVALYTFFPLVSELATEIADGVFMRQSQVRIMGANAASEDPEKTIVLIDLVPLGEQFDSTTAYVTSQRFWKKKVTIKSSLFGDYEVLYVRYPGLPPSPPTAPAGIGGQPYGRGKSGQTIKPLGVDVSKQRHNNKPSASIIVIIVLSACVAAILSCLLTWILLSKRRDRNLHLELTQPATVPSLTKSSGVAGSMLGSGPISASLSFESSIATYTGSAKAFSSADIERATNNFNDSQVLGEGGFGRVYSGVLEDGTEVAVKVLKRDDQQGGREFLAEIEMLSRLHHRNLVRLIGMCTEDRMRCLVYELIPNGSVESHLHGDDKETAPLDWSSRLKIALGAARALAYLHEDSSPRVIHRDFKSSNILLETDFTPKVSDFGLARTALDEENQHISTRVMGTFGYVAPEYAMTGHLLVKSDVYSYGVVLLELLTGRKPVDMSQPPGQENLVAWARPLLTSREGLESIIEPSLGPDFPLDSLAKVAAIASMCVQPEVSHRPFMGEVVQALKLVCNESEETNDLGTRSGGTSHEDLSVDFDATRISTNSEYLQNQSPLSSYEHERDMERGFPMSDLHGAASAAFVRLHSGNSYRRRSSSGPLRTGRTLLLWERMKRLSRGGSISEHRDFSRLWPMSR